MGNEDKDTCSIVIIFLSHTSFLLKVRRIYTAGLFSRRPVLMDMPVKKEE
jgi:hypothetical protein